MPVYKDEKRNTWFCKCNYKDWLGVSKSKMKRCLASMIDAELQALDYLVAECTSESGLQANASEDDTKSDDGAF